MQVLAVLLVSTAVFRLLGALGSRRFAGWAPAAAHGTAVMLLMTGTAHFVPAGVAVMPNHADLVAMVPPFVPFADAVVYASGVLEWLAAAGLVLAGTRWAAAAGLVALYVALLPANIYAAVADVPFAGGEATPLVQRIPEQLLYIAVALGVAAGSDRAPAVRLLASVRARLQPAAPLDPASR